MILDFKKKCYVLAPLAGWTDLPFRQTVKAFGADLTVSEMISSNALVYNVKRTAKMIEKSPLEDPYSVQLAGSSPEIIQKAVEILNAVDGIDIIDLNCGCPAPKVVRGGSGSQLLTDLPLLSEIVKTIKKTSNKSMTSVKMRLGFEKKSGTDIARRVEDSGADFLAVHGRTRAGGYKSEVDYDAIAEIKAAVSIPVIANGDITSFEKAQEVLAHTNADGVMIGRGAMGKPWIFQQLKEGRADISPEMVARIVMTHYDNMLSHHGAEIGVPMFRKHLHNYSKGYAEATTFRNTVNRIDDPEEARVCIREFFGA